MPEKFIPFTGFSPGSPEHGTGLLRAENVIPALGAWRPMSQKIDGGALVGSGAILGGYCHTYPTGAGTGTYVGDAQTEFWGTRTNLYTYAAGAFTSVSRGGGYGAGALVPSEWNLCSFGNDIWAANGVDVMQRRTNNAGNFADGVTGSFIPVARHLTTVGEFLVAGFLNQASYFADQVVWSDVGDATYFTQADATRPASLAGQQRIRSRRGQITGLVGGEFGRIFKRRSLHSMILSGDGNAPFNFNEISGTTGTPCGKSVVECADGYLRFWGGDGFYKQAGISPPERISPPSVNNLLIEANMDTIWNYSMTRATSTTMYIEGLRIVGAESQQSGIVFWLYQTRAIATDLLMTRMIVHDTTSGEWGVINLEGDAGASYLSDLTGVSCIISAPINSGQSQSLTWDILGAATNGADVTHIAFNQVTPMQATFATQRFALAAEGSLSTTSPRITGFMPVMAREALSSSPDYNLRPLPSGVTVRVIAANDPHFTDVVDEAGTQVSPRSELLTRDTDFGWFTGAAQGRWFIVEMVYPAGGVNERGFTGGYVRWE